MAAREDEELASRTATVAAASSSLLSRFIAGILEDSMALPAQLLLLLSFGTRYRGVAASGLLRRVSRECWPSVLLLCSAAATAAAGGDAAAAGENAATGGTASVLCLPAQGGHT